MKDFSKLLSRVTKAIRNCEFLPSHNIVVDSRSVVYYSVSGVFTMAALGSLISIAEKFKLSYYVCNDFNGLAFRMYIPKFIFDE